MDQDYVEMRALLGEAQEAEYDNRQRVREAEHFLHKRDGQWESRIRERFSGKPKYTFDECNPIVDDIMGEMQSAEFGIKVRPDGGGATMKIAKQYDGIIRTLQNISRAKFTFMSAARAMVGTGISGWRIVQDYRDDDSFQQDLLIKPIPNFVDNVWFDPNASMQTMEDANHCWVLTSMTKAEYEKKYPSGSGRSVGLTLQQQVYDYKKPDEVVIGEYLYRKKRNRELALMSNGSIFEMDDEFEKIKDDLAGKGVTIVRTRKRPYYDVYQKIFDGDDWLSDAKRTVFNFLPIVPVFGDFLISENKVIYNGVVEKIRDAQRVINYANSRKIEEGALAPRGKVWMTKDQATSSDVRKSLRTLNTNMEPVQFYDYTDGQTPPQYMGAPESNPGLVETSASAQNFIQRISGTFDEARGAAPAHRSGEAIGLLQRKSDNPKRKWFSAVETAIEHTCRILIKAIPKVYDTQQEMTLTHQDGTTETITIREKVLDGQSGEIVELNDLSKGSYDVVCTSGPPFQSRQQETVTAINEMAAIDPTIMEIGADILLSNINAPGIDQIAERKRLQMVNAGLIPQSQLRDDEKKMLQQKKQSGQDMSAIDRANLQIAAAQEADVKGKNTERAAKLELEQSKLQLKQIEMQLKAQAEQEKLKQSRQQKLIDTMTAISEQVKAQAETLKLIREAMGADAIMSNAPVQAYERQAQELANSIDNQHKTEAMIAPVSQRTPGPNRPQPTGGIPAMPTQA